MRKLRELDVKFIEKIDKAYKKLKENNILIDKKKICISIKAHRDFDCLFLSCFSISSKFDCNFKNNDKMILHCSSRIDRKDNKMVFYSKIVDKHSIRQEIDGIKEDFIDEFEIMRCPWNCMTRHKAIIEVEDDE